MRDPVGLDAPAPLLTWTLAGNGRQSAYQIQVAATADAFLNGRAEHWDTGRMEGEAMAIAYAGQPLASRARCHWRVRVWDEAGQPGDWSEPAVFELGLLAAADWQARWIGRPEHDAGIRTDPDHHISVGSRIGTPRIALPQADGDGQRRYRLGKIALNKGI